MKVVTPEEMAAIDRQAIEECQIPSLLLMEHAGVKVVEAIRREVPDLLAQKFLVICGGGNNGGDGLVVARLLARAGAVVGVELLRSYEDLKGDPAVNLRMLEAYGVEMFNALPGRPLSILLNDATMVIDAMLGTGARGDLRGVFADAAAQIAECGKPVVAIDVPTGLDAETGQPRGIVPRAAFTVTMGLPKLGFFNPPAPDHLGRLHVAEIGFPPGLLESRGQGCETTLAIAREMRSLLPARRPDSHKGSYGRVLVVGGSEGMVGAAVMAARAALRAGAGLVRLVVPASQHGAAASLAPEVMVGSAGRAGAPRFGAADANRLSEGLEWSDVTLLGPGIGRGDDVTGFVRQIMGNVEGPLVIDADALHALSSGEPVGVEEALLTPHPGEMAHLMDTSSARIREDRPRLAREAVERLRAHLVLKGPWSLVASPGGALSINPTGNAGMATAGSGDVLAGVIAALRAFPGMTSRDALRLACYVHGLAGDLAADSIGPISMTAIDILEHIPGAFRLLGESDTGLLPQDRIHLV